MDYLRRMPVDYSNPYTIDGGDWWYVHLLTRYNIPSFFIPQALSLL